MATLSRTEQFEKLKGILQHNIQTLWRQLAWLRSQPENMRLFRITSEFLPLYTVPAYAWLYDSYEIKELIAEGLRGVRSYAKQNGIRLSLHPGQFTNFCSTRKDVVKASIIDFEYHAMMANLMGFGDTWHSDGFAINIHANINQDPGLKQIRRVIANDLSDVARNLITIENDEYGCGVRDMLDTGIQDDVALVLDTHHDWVNTKGDVFIWYKEHQAFAFRDSWRGIRPLGHFSMPDDSQLPPATIAAMAKNIETPDYSKLVAQAVKPRITSKTLRTHSYDMWNQQLLDKLRLALKHMDMEIEAKGKNVASRQVYKYFENYGGMGFCLWDLPADEW